MNQTRRRILGPGPVLAGLLLTLGLASGSARGGEPLRLTLRPWAATPGGAGPAALELARGVPTDAEDRSGSFSVLVQGPPGTLPSSAVVSSRDRRGALLDQLEPSRLEPTACPPGVDRTQACAVTRSIRLVASALDRDHPAALGAALLGQLGGQVQAEAAGRAHALPVLGPLGLGAAAYQAAVRVRVLRLDRGGQPALGADDAEAEDLARRALLEAGALLGPCGVLLGPEPADVRVVDPPPAQLLEVGCHGGLPASGGKVQLSTTRGTVELATRRGESAGSVAGRLARELGKRGLLPHVFENPASEASAGSTYDLVVPTKTAPVLLAPPAGTLLSTDPTLQICLGELDLADGLRHFEDETARAGTLEERVLLRGIADLDPGTLDVLIVPYFGGRGRIGESFIGDAGSSLENMVILDRAGVRATARSSTLAHELGHVLLAQPGHPDDFGLDRPELLMDADASDASAFGPRRLGLEECKRMLVEHGPESPRPLLTPWAPGETSARQD